jgi:perosamine synthetase
MDEAQMDALRRQTTLPYGRQTVEPEDIEAVTRVLQGDWLTTGPSVAEFESSFSSFVKTEHAIAVNSGTAALHCAMHAIGISAGDEVIVPAISFAATANCVVYQGGTPVFADVDPQTLLIDVEDLERLITPRTRAIIAVDFAGQPCDYDALRSICARHDLRLVADACHSVGASYHDLPCGSLADLTAFSFHPVKAMTTGEGGMVTTDNAEFAAKIRQFRNHGIVQDFRQRDLAGQWEYDIELLGFNYRISDFQCALGNSQLKKLPEWITRRRQIAQRYTQQFAGMEQLQPLDIVANTQHAYHLYVVRIDSRLSLPRSDVYQRLRSCGINVNVHYRPIYLHSFYRNQFGYSSGLCPNAEWAYEQILTLPVFPRMTDADVDFVIEQVQAATASGSSIAA